jgi:hypothetical protein
MFNLNMSLAGGLAESLLKLAQQVGAFGEHR